MFNKSILLLSTLEIVLVCIVIALVLFIIFYFLTGKALFKLIVKRDNHFGRGISRKLRKMAKRYKIDYGWWDKFPNEILSVESEDKLTLYARFLKAPNEDKKVAIVVHGFFADYKDMQTYCKYFYSRGYNVVALDNRAHGMSQGDVVGMGWLDRLDVLKWIELVIKKFGKDCQIVLFGLSMGGATVCMTCGESLPPNVKCAIADSSYDSVYNEFYYVMKKELKLPAWSLINMFETYYKLNVGASIKEQSCVEQVKKTKTPILLIHGTGDNFVPFEMHKTVFDAIPENLREEYVVENAWHCEAQAKNVRAYNLKLDKWLEKFVIENNKNQE